MMNKAFLHNDEPLFTVHYQVHPYFTKIITKKLETLADKQHECNYFATDEAQFVVKHTNMFMTTQCHFAVDVGTVQRLVNMKQV